MTVLCRDAEWLVQRVEASNDAGTQHAVHVVGVDDLVRGLQAIFLTQLDKIEPVDPRKTKLVPDNSNGFRRSKLFGGSWGVVVIDEVGMASRRND